MSYRVEFKTFKSGEWYTKAEFSDEMEARAVAMSCNLGRAYRVTDTITGEITCESNEDSYWTPAKACPE